MILNEDSLLEMLETMPSLWNPECLEPRNSQASSQTTELEPTSHSSSNQQRKKHSSSSTSRPALRPLPLPSLSPDLKQVFQVVALDPVALDFIVENSSMPTGTVLGLLSQLELMGLVAQLPGMLYQRC